MSASTSQDQAIAQEYSSLREEILRWQDRRFTVLSGSAAIVTAVIAWEIKQADLKDWIFVSAMLLLILSAANGFTWYCGRGNAMIGAYLAVFHNQPQQNAGTNLVSPPYWETGLPDFRQRLKDKWIANHFFGIFYATLALTSVIIPALKLKSTDGNLGRWIFIPSVAIFLISWRYVGRGAPRSKYVEIWNDIRAGRRTNEPKTPWCQPNWIIAAGCAGLAIVGLVDFGVWFALKTGHIWKRSLSVYAFWAICLLAAEKLTGKSSQNKQS